MIPQPERCLLTGGRVRGKETACLFFHFGDPIPFARPLLATLEHGHANDYEVHYRSVAYWYGRPLTEHPPG